MKPRFKGWHPSIRLLIIPFISFDFTFHFKKALNTSIVNDTFLIIPHNHYFVTYILVNLPVIIDNRIGDVSKKILQKTMIGLRSQPFSNGSRRVEINKHKYSIFFFRFAILASNDFPQSTLPKFCIHLENKLCESSDSPPHHSVPEI